MLLGSQRAYPRENHGKTKTPRQAREQEPNGNTRKQLGHLPNRKLVAPGKGYEPALQGHQRMIPWEVSYDNPHDII